MGRRFWGLGYGLKLLQKWQPPLMQQLQPQASLNSLNQHSKSTISLTKFPHFQRTKFKKSQKEEEQPRMEEERDSTFPVRVMKSLLMESMDPPPSSLGSAHCRLLCAREREREVGDRQDLRALLCTKRNKREKEERER